MSDAETVSFIIKHNKLDIGDNGVLKIVNRIPNKRFGDENLWIFEVDLGTNV